MTRAIRPFLLAVLLAQPLAAQRIDTVSSRVVVPGVVYRQLADARGPWSINVIAVDLGRRELRIETVRADDSIAGRETVSSMVQRHSTDTALVVAAVNADFFDLTTGRNEGNQIVDGELLPGAKPLDLRPDSSRTPRWQFAINATGHPFIDQFAFAGALARDASFGMIPPANHSETPDRGPLITLVGGWPRLVIHGRSIADSADALEGTTPAFSVTRHPRTGLGFSRDSSTLYLITVDGRQESSSGMSLVEFSRLMLSLGVYEGLNLDGGGSTTMVIDGAVVNKPSDPTGERPVGDALIVVLRRIRE